MADHSELKRSAKRVIDIEASDGGEPVGEAWDQFESVATPSAVFALIAEVERLRTAEGDAMTYKAGMENVAQQRDQLKAEISGLKTGYEAYEQVNAGLKAENETLVAAAQALRDEWRKDQADAERYRWLRTGQRAGLCIDKWHYGGTGEQMTLEEADAAIDAAMGKGEQS